MKNLGQFFQEDNGQYSATRLAFLAWIFGILIVWGSGSFHDKKMQEIPSSIQILIGVLMTGKVAQKISESSSPETSDKPQEAKPDKLTSSKSNENGTVSASIR
ncbi:MAG: hypothetical protein KME14_14710 [Tildeniella torsiva UHER 1998/13D]|nr:hypothetical protein [Tildeniella torsiva UHER 1998/13D]